MTLSVRTARLVVLVTWSAFLTWLYVEGEVAPNLVVVRVGAGGELRLRTSAAA